ncbi:hypothetical protein BH23PAT2_BH23PAT2_09200 [soil metagenome]
MIKGRELLYLLTPTTAYVLVTIVTIIGRSKVVIVSLHLLTKKDTKVIVHVKKYMSSINFQHSCVYRG